MPSRYHVARWHPAALLQDGIELPCCKTTSTCCGMRGHQATMVQDDNRVAWYRMTSRYHDARYHQGSRRANEAVIR
eukprot:6821133-Pyramimonas_sp.AAC.1